MEERKGLLGRVMEKCAVTARLHQNYLRREMGKTGISKSQRQLLLYIEKNPGATQREIAARRNVSTASVAVAVKKLDTEASMFSGFSEEEILQFENFLNRIIKNGESLLQEESR